MDAVRFLNDVTGGHLLAWKVVAASLTLMLAGLQVAMAAQFWGVGNLPISPRTAAGVHRWNGRALLVLATAVAFACLVGPAGPTSPTRVLLHSLFGTLLFIALIGKLALLKFVRAGQQFLPVTGIVLFLTFMAIWATSVADYVSRR
jgi:hypothetical protein